MRKFLESAFIIVMTIYVVVVIAVFSGLSSCSIDSDGIRLEVLVDRNV